MDTKAMARTRMESMKQRAVEIKEALRTLKKSHGLILCQVWIPKCVKVENEEWMYKLGGYYTAAFKDYYNACVKIQDGPGGLADKAYETYQSYFSKNINNIIKGELQALIPATAVESSCCVGICLRNSDNEDYDFDDYAFEFIFKSYDNNNNNNNNPCVFLESLFSKLESCLSNFKFSSGAQLGSELLVLDVEDPTSSFNIFSTKKQQGEVDCEGSSLRRWNNIKFGDYVHHASVEIKQALSFLTDSHGLTLAQVWMYPYVNRKNEKFAVKIEGYYADGFKDYYDACRRIRQGAGGLTLKTLVTSLPYFSRNIISSAKLQPYLLPATSSSSETTTCCLVVCLKNVYTGDFDYAFELYFSFHKDDKDPCVFLESLLVTLEKCLPSFKHFSGARLSRRELPILDGDNLAVSFDMLAFIKQEEDDCKDEIFVYTNDKGHRIYAMDVSAASSVKVADLKTKISQRFNLVSNAYRLGYLVKGKGPTGRLWVPLLGDQDMKRCIRYCTRQKVTRLLVRVLPRTISIQGGVHKQLPNPDSQNEGGVCTQLPAKRRHIS